MEMTLEIANKILDRNLTAICPGLVVSQPVREAFLAIATNQGLRRIIDTILVSSRRSIAAHQSILFVYRLL